MRAKKVFRRMHGQMYFVSPARAMPGLQPRPSSDRIWRITPERFSLHVQCGPLAGNPPQPAVEQCHWGHKLLLAYSVPTPDS